MSAGLYNPTIEQGATYQKTITWRDATGVLVDLTSYTARAQYRTSHESTVKVVDLTTENGGITLGGVLGTIDLLISATATAALTAHSGVWDLELVSATGVVDRLLEGTYEVTPEVTR
jgi:hypothetical protein